jgi:DNA-binding SARP family transcriptional activator/Tfp pilus assembly protein PilF
MTAAKLQLFVLGPFELSWLPSAADTPGAPSTPDAGHASEISAATLRLRRKTRALLAYLATAQQPLHRQRLAALFFPETDDPPGALRWQLSEIRRQLDAEILTVERDVVQLNQDICWVDAFEFEQALAEPTEKPAATSSPAPSLSQKMSALRLYRGDFLADISVPDAPEFEIWLLGERARYLRMYEDGLSALIEQLMQHKQYADALPWAQRFWQSNALSEQAVVYLMQLYAQTGQREAALSHYEQYRHLLQMELAVEPEATVTALHDEIVAGRMRAAALPASSPPPAVQTPSRPHNIPARTTPIVGREVEQAQLHALLADPSYRLVTLVGPGGIGKTCLALHVAAGLAQSSDAHFSDGVYLASLIATLSGDSLAPILADAVGLSFSGAAEPKQQLLSFLRTKTLLLVLDNFEHLVQEADLLVEILQAAGSVTLLVTSRTRLNIYEEWCFNLQPLNVPNDTAAENIETYSAVQLFVQRAQHIRRDFTLAEQATEVVQICQLLDGMPLAIELAAGWVRTHTCREIAEELQRNLDFLTTDLRNVPERHRSMHAALEHSWRLLSPADRAAFARLSVFHGSFGRRAAEQVSGVTLPTLRSLIDASMLYIPVNGRYQIHELLRQFGADKLESTVVEDAVDEIAGDLRQRHSLFYADFIQQRDPHRLTAQEPAAVQEIAAALDNIRAGLEWAVMNLCDPRRSEAVVTVINQSALMLAYFYHMRSRFREGFHLFEQAATRMDAAGWSAPDPADRLTSEKQLAYARVCLGEALLCFGLSQFAQMEQIVARVLPFLRAHAYAHELAEALSLLGRTHTRMGKRDAAELELRESLHWYQSIDAHLDSTEVCNSLASLASDQGLFDEAQELFEACLAIYEETGYVRGMARGLNNLGSNYVRRGDYHQGKACYDKAFELIQQVDELLLHTVILSNLGSVSRTLGEYAQSIHYYEESLTIFRRMGELRWTAASLNGLGMTFFDAGDFMTARIHLREALDIALSIQSIPDAFDSIAGLGEIMAADDETQAAGLVIVNFVMAHPTTRSMARLRIQQIVARFNAQIPPAQAQAAAAQAKDQTLDQIVAAIKRYFPS